MNGSFCRVLRWTGYVYLAFLVCGCFSVSYANDDIRYDSELDAPFGEPDDTPPKSGTTIRKKRPKPKEKKAKRKHRGTLMVGAGFGSVEGFVLNAQIAGRSLFGVDGLHLSLSTQMSGLRQQFLLKTEYAPSTSPFFVRLQFQQLRRSLFTLREKDANGDDLDPVSLMEDNIGGMLMGGIKRSRGWRLGLGYKLAFLSMEDQGIGSKLPSFRFGQGLMGKQKRASSVVLSLMYDTPDGVDAQTGFLTGMQFRATFEGAAPITGSEVTFAKADISLRGGVKLPFGMHLSAGLSGGILLGDERQLPLSMRYRTGGALGSSQWLQDIGPSIQMDKQRLSVGGIARLQTHAELRVPLFRKAGLYLFGRVEAAVLVNAGQVLETLPGQGIARARVNWTGAGIVGLLWDSPIGRMRFGFSVPFVREEGMPPVMFGFSMGQ
jgi:outer membrane protein assembly factor BamA